MKKIIAAALSVLVGAFGYTIVDSAIEDRVSTLESEVVELREEVSRYHPQYTTLPYESTTFPSGYTTLPFEGDTTGTATGSTATGDADDACVGNADDDATR